MVAIRTRFDGEKIEVPPELRGAAPGEVIVIFTPLPTPTTHSIWDVVGKCPSPRSAEEIDRTIAEERDAWNDR
jgi:hypothetical protein